MKQIAIDHLDQQLLTLIQKDASISNQELAEKVRTSAPTCLRRLKRLSELGVIERQIAVLNPEKIASIFGHGLTAIIEVTLDRQDVDALRQFEERTAAEPAVQQCYRVSPGPDFVLVVHVPHMEAYQSLTQGLFTTNANVRNVKAFFSIKRSKFGAELPLS